MRRKDTFEKKFDATRRDSARAAADAIMNGFIWDETIEGHAYWSEVHTKLEDIASDATRPARKPKVTK